VVLSSFSPADGIMSIPLCVVFRRASRLHRNVGTAKGKECIEGCCFEGELFVVETSPSIPARRRKAPTKVQSEVLVFKAL